MEYNMLRSLQNMDEIHFWDNRPFIGAMPESRRCKPSDVKKTIKKKAKRIRTAYTTEQLKALEVIFNQSKYITPERRQHLARALNIGDKSIKIWFQNRRMKEKRESSECSSDSCSENIAGEKSPSATFSTESDSTDQTNAPNENLSTESCQYQVPYFYEYIHNESDGQIQNANASDYNTFDYSGKKFSNDNNVYPTQYFPYDGNNTSEYNYYQCQQDNYYSNYCLNTNMSSEFSDLCCFYN